MALKNVSVKMLTLLGINVGWKRKGCRLDESLTD